MNQTAQWLLLFCGLCSLGTIGLLEECDLTSDLTQCRTDHICRDGACEKALPCGTGCGQPGTSCVADYCQSAVCTVTGQCVHGQKCSQNDYSKSCVYPVIIEVKENTKVVLHFTKPGLGGVYEEIRWNKDTTSSAGRIVFLHPTATEGKPLYYNGYCTESSPCLTSSKGKLNVNTGKFTINNVQIADEGFYYYRFYINNGSPDTGHKYEIYMEVYVQPIRQDIVLESKTEEITVNGTVLNLTCAVARVKPEAQIYWMIDERRENGSDSVTTNEDGTFKQISEIRITDESVAENVRCVVDPVYGDAIEVEMPPTPLPSEVHIPLILVWVIGGALLLGFIAVIIVVIIKRSYGEKNTRTLVSTTLEI